MSGSRFLADLPSLFSDGCDELAGACAAGFGGTVSYEEDKAPPKAAPSRRAVLARAIETEIIPRLMLSHRVAPRSAGKSKYRVITSEEVTEFARIIAHHDVSIGESYVEALVEQGASVETIFAKVFAPAARLLGEWWESDQSTFSEVTIGLAKIHQLIHKFSPSFAAEAEPRLSSFSALLTPIPGEHHSLGILLLEQYFRRGGWNVWTPVSSTDTQLVNMVRQEHYDVVGISVTCDADIDRLSELIRRLRKASLNKELSVMVGGRVVNERPDFVSRVGADATDVDGSQAVHCVEARISRLRGG